LTAFQSLCMHPDEIYILYNTISLYEPLRTLYEPLRTLRATPHPIQYNKYCLSSAVCCRGNSQDLELLLCYFYYLSFPRKGQILARLFQTGGNNICLLLLHCKKRLAVFPSYLYLQLQCTYLYLSLLFVHCFTEHHSPRPIPLKRIIL
jgi:hypothetical protein